MQSQKKSEPRGIFISYRRQDSQYVVDRINDALRRHYAKNTIFVDIDGLRPGVDFREELKRAVEQSRVMLAVIGPSWLDARDSDGNRRLDNPDDFVRREIASAIADELTLIPVLVDGAKMPTEAQLPEPIRALVWRHALSVSRQHFQHDMTALIAAIDQVQPASARKSLWRIGAATAGVVAALAAGFTQFYGGVRDGANPQPNETRADGEMKAALNGVRTEILDNLRAIAASIAAAASAPPKPFEDIRRPNETEASFQDRAKNNFRDYQRYLDQMIALEVAGQRFSTATYQALRLKLLGDEKIAATVKGAYDGFDGARDALDGLKRQFTHLTGLDLTDGERTDRALSVHREKLAEARIHLVKAAGHMALLTDKAVDMDITSSALTNAGIATTLAVGSAGWSAAMKAAAELQADKAKVFATRVEAMTTAKRREIDRRVKDPYLVMQRKAVGRGEDLSDGELRALETRALDTTEQDPAKLFELAAFAFQESDGHATGHYYKRAIATGKLNDWQKRFAVASLDRLARPSIYGDVLGVFVIRTSEGGGFAKAGVLPGDVIVRIAGSAVNEPSEIASALAKAEGTSVPIDVIREGGPVMLTIPTREAAGAILSQLVLLNAIQL